MKALDLARRRVRALSRNEAVAFVSGVGLLVAGGLLSVPALMFSGLFLLAIGRRILDALERARASMFSLELGGDAIDREPAPVVSETASDPDPSPRPMPLAVRALVAAAIVVIIALLVSFVPARDARKQRWTFLEVPANVEVSGAWTVEDHASATGGRAMTKTDGPPDVFVASALPARDVRAMTRCKGEGCGLAFRIAGEGTYSVARIAGERVEIVRVSDGREDVLGSAPLAASGADLWQELVVEARADVVRVYVNGARTVEVHDARPAAVGGVGLWAPSRAWFDELSIETFVSAPQAIEVLPLLGRAS